MRTVIASLVLLSCAACPLRADPVALGHGINFGNYLEAPREGAWGGVLQEQDFATIRQAGFTTVRVPICWSAHLVPNDPHFTIDPAFLARIDWVVAEANHYGLNAILDYHNDDALMKDPGGQAPRYLAIWQQIAIHYADAPPNIVFELLNEPNGKLDAPHWNALLAQALAIVRLDNPVRSVVIGPVHWNTIGDLKNLVLPGDDHNLIATVHFYDPLTFTHQGASWIKGADQWHNVTWQGTPAETVAVVSAFAQASAWGQANHRPIFLGEFGAYSKGDIDSRVRWITCVARTAEADGFTWAYWEYSAGFGAYDPKAQQWREPILKALLPDSTGN